MRFLYIELLTYLLLISFIVRTLRNVFYQTFLWQLKEYRIDRFWAHLKTDQGKRLILGSMTLLKWILLLFIIGDILSEYKLLPETIIDFGFFGFLAYMTFGSVWIIEAIINLRELVISGWKVPVFTLKIIVILGVVLILQFAQLGTGGLTGLLLSGPFFDKLLAFSVAFFVLLFNIPSFLFKKTIVLLAKRKMSRYRNLKVIGITGSYGKTSTKEFLAQIISTKYKILKTEGSTNTEIGIAQTILGKLKEEHEVFIVEMGAYKKGEIAAIARIVKPQIGIITGINEQHIELFGSIEKTMKAKFELIKHLEYRGTAVFNKDNKWVNKMILWVERKRSDLSVVTYGSNVGNEQRSKEYKLVASDIKVKPENIRFNVSYNGKKESFELRLAGEQNVVNFLAALVVALKLHFTLSEIKKIADNIQAPAKTMKRIVGIQQAVFIDDTFNANPDGVIASLEYMKLFKGRRVLVLTPLIELGKETEKIHKLLGGRASSICDLILLTNFNYNKSFIEGAEQSDGQEKVQIVNMAVGEKLIKQNIDKDGVVVFEGKEAKKILDKLVKLSG